MASLMDVVAAGIGLISSLLEIGTAVLMAHGLAARRFARNGRDPRPRSNPSPGKRRAHSDGSPGGHPAVGAAAKGDAPVRQRPQPLPPSKARERSKKDGKERPHTRRERPGRDPPRSEGSRPYAGAGKHAENSNSKRPGGWYPPGLEDVPHPTKKGTWDHDRV